MLSTIELTHCVGKAPVPAPCQPMNTADGSDWATARAASIAVRNRCRADHRERRQVGRRDESGPAPARVGHGAHAIRSAATLLPNNG